MLSYLKNSGLKIFKISIVLSLVVALASCAWTREKLDIETEIQVKFTISPMVNPDSDGRASPVVLNLLYLKDNRQFEQEDFIALLESPEDRLGKDLIEKVRLKEFIPSEKRLESFVLPNNVKYVGVIVEYVQYQDANGKLVLPIEAHKTNGYFVNVDKDSISIKE